MKKMKSAIRGLMLLLMLSMTYMPVASASKTTPQTDCDNCGSGCSDATVVELKNEDKNVVVAEALANEDVKKLRLVLIENGHTPKVDDATVFEVATKEGSGTQVGIPFKPNDDYTTAGISYVNTGENYQVIAIEEWNEGDKTFARLYHVDAEGNIVSEVVDIDWGCVADCIVEECSGCFYPGPPGICSGCCIVCAPCVAFPNPLTCGVCAGCVALVTGTYCMLQCP